MRPVSGRVILVLLGVATLFVAGCVGNDRVRLIDSGEFEGLMEENVFVVNTHTPYEGEIPGTDLVIEDWRNIHLYADLLPEDKDVKILVYCMTGRMSASASRQIVDLGYENVYDLNGGMVAWSNSGRSIVSEDRNI